MITPVDYAPSQNYGDNPTKNLPASSWLIQTFGNYQPDGHSGIDYPCPSGTPIRAVAAGVVLHVGWFGGTYADNPWWIQPSFAGFTYVIDHGTFIGIYGHCLNGGARVSAGQRVAEGQIIGLSGNTGASTGDHLHFEALPDGYVLNSRMYGRIDPITLFSTLNYASESITPLEEEDMPLSKEDVEWIVGRVTEEAQKIANVDREYIPGAVWKQKIDWRNPATGELVRGATTPETVLSYMDTNTSRVLDAKSIAAGIPEELVQGVAELLAARMEGK